MVDHADGKENADEPDAEWHERSKGALGHVLRRAGIPPMKPDQLIGRVVCIMAAEGYCFVAVGSRWYHLNRKDYRDTWPPAAQDVISGTATPPVPGDRKPRLENARKA